MSALCDAKLLHVASRLLMWRLCGYILFFDGNGRLARLLANIPVLAAGFPPIVVPSEARLDYIRELWEYQRAVGVISLANCELLPEPSRLGNLRSLVKDWWQRTLDLVAEAKGAGSR